MAIGSVVTRGYGAPGSVNLVVTRGYSIGAAVVSSSTFVAERPPQLRVDFYNNLTGAKLDVPPIAAPQIFAANYQHKIGTIGTFTLQVAADAPAAENAISGRRIWIYDGNVVVFKGVIRTREIGVDATGRLVLTLVGPSIADQLIGLTTGRGLVFEDDSLTTVVTSLLTSTDFDPGSIDTATITARRFDGRTKWDALMATAQAVDCSIREDILPATPLIDMGVFGTSTGITLRNFPASSESLSTNPYMKQIAALKVKAQSLDLCNRVVPWGQLDGLGGSQLNLGNIAGGAIAMRLYLGSLGSGTPAVSPAYDASWEQTASAVRLTADTAAIPGFFPGAVAVTDAVSTNPYDMLRVQYVYGPISQQTISGSVKAQFVCEESDAAANSTLQMLIRVVSSDGSTVRGTALAHGTYGSEFNTTARNITFPSTALSSVDAQDGDYLVIEVGVRNTNGVSTSYTSQFYTGSDSTAADLPVDETSTSTTLNPWIEFTNFISPKVTLPSGETYPVLSDTGHDGNLFYYIEDTDSQAIYGVRERWVQFKDILPLGLTSVDFAAASSTLYGMAVTYLTRHLAEQVAYEVDVMALRHVNPDTGVPYFKVGDTIKLQFDGWTQDSDGTRISYLNVDTDLYILDFTVTYDSAGTPMTKLTLATFLRALPTDGEAFRAISQAMAIEQVSPPFSSGSAGNVFDVREFGATEGVDATAYVQAAIDAANLEGGGIVSFPAGTYTLSTLTLYSNIHLQGSGIEATKLSLKGGTNAALLQGNDFTALAAGDTTGGIHDFSIQAMTLDGNKANNGTAGYGIRVYGYRYVLRDLAIRDFFTNGIYSQWSSASSENMEAMVDNVRVYSSISSSDGSGSNVYWLGPHDSVFVGCYFFYGAAKGFEAAHVDKAAGLQFINCHAYGNHQTYGWYLVGDGCSLTGCVSEGAITAQIWLGSNNQRVAECYVFAAGASAPVGVEVATTVSGYTISGTILNCTSNAVKIAGTDGGNGFIDITTYQTSGAIVGGTLASNTDYRVRGDGGGTGAGFRFTDKHLGNLNVQGNLEMFDGSGNSKAYWQGSDGAFVFGGDTAFYRSAAGVLQTAGQIIAEDGFRMKTKAGVPTDADTTTDASGVCILDTTNSRIYFRVGSTWKYAALT